MKSQRVPFAWILTERQTDVVKAGTKLTKRAHTCFDRASICESMKSAFLNSDRCWRPQKASQGSPAPWTHSQIIVSVCRKSRILISVQQRTWSNCDLPWSARLRGACTGECSVLDHSYMLLVRGRAYGSSIRLIFDTTVYVIKFEKSHSQLVVTTEKNKMIQ